MMIPQLEVEPIENVKAALEKYFAENEGFSRGIRFYTPHEWGVVKGEEIGRDADLSIVIEESLLCTILNGYGGIDLESKVEMELASILEPMGYYASLGFSWSLHIYQG